MNFWDRLWQVLGSYSIMMLLAYIDNKKRHKAEIENMELRFKLFKEQKENELKEADQKYYDCIENFRERIRNMEQAHKEEIENIHESYREKDGQ